VKSEETIGRLTCQRALYRELGSASAPKNTSSRRVRRRLTEAVERKRRGHSGHLKKKRGEGFDDNSEVEKKQRSTPLTHSPAINATVTLEEKANG